MNETTDSTPPIKICIFYGTRPEVIKLASIIKVLETDSRFSLKIIHTGQHQDLTYELEKLFEIKPDVRLKLTANRPNLNVLLSEIISSASTLLQENTPDLVFVQGDTSTVMGVALSCFNLGIKVAHVEAGLRSFNLKEPFPEELNRKITTLCTNFHFAPTEAAKLNLQKEGILESQIWTTGNTVVDAALLIKNQLKINIVTKNKILITAHRRENHGKPIENICKAVLILAKQNPNFIFSWPLHPNPNVREPVEKALKGHPNIVLLPPLSYDKLLTEIAEAYLIWTDSGGIQEEVPTFKKPVFILRNVTERPEVIESGFGKLCGTDTDLLVSLTQQLIDSPSDRDKMIAGNNPFGDGTAALEIVKICYEALI